MKFCFLLYFSPFECIRLLIYFLCVVIYSLLSALCCLALGAVLVDPACHLGILSAA